MHLTFDKKFGRIHSVRMQFFNPKCRKKQYVGWKVGIQTSSDWKNNLPPLFSVEMFADSVVGLRAKLAKSREVTELTCLNLFTVLRVPGCLAAWPPGCLAARLPGLCGKTRELAAAWGARQYVLYREPTSVSWWSHFCTNKRQSSRVWVCKVHINVWVGMVLEFGFWMDLNSSTTD